MRTKLIAGNWKMHGSLVTNQRLLEALVAAVGGESSVEVAVLAPYPYLSQLQSLLAKSSIRWGAQDVSEHVSGAYTGEVGGAMLADFGCAYVIVGHSERRALYGDTDRLVGGKAKAALAAGVSPIVCLGETLAERESGRTLEVVLRQLTAVVEVVGAAALQSMVLAYEPVWAIGTGKTATPEQAQEVHAAIRGHVSALDVATGAAVRILYGGSVKPAGARELFAMPDIDGGLVGGASLVAEEFLAICNAARF